MSAWITPNDHINCLGTWAAANDVAGVKGDEASVAKVLMDQNVRSVDTRYSETNKNTYKFKPVPAALNMAPVVILKSLACLDYQPNETDDYDTTEAKQINSAMEHKAMQLALSVPELVALRLMNEEYDISQLPGYKEAPWGLTPPTRSKKPQAA